MAMSAEAFTNKKLQEICEKLEALCEDYRKNPKDKAIIIRTKDLKSLFTNLVRNGLERMQSETHAIYLVRMSWLLTVKAHLQGDKPSAKRLLELISSSFKENYHIQLENLSAGNERDLYERVVKYF